MSKGPTLIDEGRNPQGYGWFFPILLELQKLFPRDTAAEIAHRSGRSVKVVERWLARKGAPDGQALVALLPGSASDPHSGGASRPDADARRRAIPPMPSVPAGTRAAGVRHV